MANERSTYIEKSARPATRSQRLPVLLGAASENEGLFEIYSYALNRAPDNSTPQEYRNKGGIAGQGGERYSFPGNIYPEGYFYSPFYEVKLKELDDELQSINTRRVNFKPSSASSSEVDITYYNPDCGYETEGKITEIKIVSPVPYDLLLGQPFCIYDILAETTHFGFLKEQNTRELTITTTAKIKESGLNGSDCSGKSQYIISYLTENAPTYAEYIPSTGKLVWRGPKKMSDLESSSDLYNMPFTNGRLYIHKNVDVFVRRQDPHGEYRIFRPSLKNPLRRFQVEGDPKLDFDYIQYIIDSMVDAC